MKRPFLEVILVADVNGDGVNDLIASHAHGYGLDWREPGEGEDAPRHHITMAPSFES